MIIEHVIGITPIYIYIKVLYNILNKLLIILIIFYIIDIDI